MLPTQPLFQQLRTIYRARTRWPPDLSQMTEKEQLLMEKKYKRRSKLKYERPRWVRSVKLAQFGIISFVLGYGLLWADWGDEEHPPFQALRNWVKDSAGSVWTSGNMPRDVLKKDVKLASEETNTRAAK